MEPHDQAFWQTLTAERGAHAGSLFYVNVRTGARQWTKPTFVRTKDKTKGGAYIRVW